MRFSNRFRLVEIFAALVVVFSLFVFREFAFYEWKSVRFIFRFPSRAIRYPLRRTLLPLNNYLE